MHPFKLLSAYLYTMFQPFSLILKCFIVTLFWYVMRHCLDSLWKTFNLLNLLFALILKNHKELDLDCSKDVALIRLFLSLSNFCFIRWCIVMTYKIHLEHTLLRSSWLCKMYSILSSEIPIYSSIILTVMGDYHLSVSPPLQFFRRQQFRENVASRESYSMYLQVLQSTSK